MDENYLAHHGILGQKHGVKNGPPYPLSRNKNYKSIRKKYAERRQKKLEEKVAKKEKSDEEKKEELKEELRKHPKRLPKHADDLTPEDLKEILSKIEWDRKLKDIRDEEIRRGSNRIKMYSEATNNFANLVNNARLSWNNVGYVYNTIADITEAKSGKHMARMKIIGVKDNPAPKKPST